MMKGKQKNKFKRFPIHRVVRETFLIKLFIKFWSSCDLFERTDKELTEIIFIDFVLVHQWSVFLKENFIAFLFIHVNP